MPTLIEAASDPLVASVLHDLEIGHAEAARSLQDLDVDTTESSVRRYRRKQLKAKVQEDLTPEPEAVPTKGSVEISPDGAQITKVVVNTPVVDNDFTAILEMFNLNPEHFEVVDDTVRMKSWWVARGSKENDTWEPLQLWSYDARFRRVNKDMIPDKKVEQWRSALLLQVIEPQDATWEQVLDPTAYAMLIADPQLGKKGTEEAVENWKTGIEKHLEQAESLIARGERIDALHVAFQGDEHENVVNSYTNQPHTVELNRSQQLELDFDLSVWTLKRVATLGLPISVSSVISNHGLWTRNDGKDPVTSHNDNSSTYIRRQVKRLFDELAPFGGPEISWTIGNDRPGIVVDLAGVPTYFSHGYIEKGKGATSELRVKNAIEEQILGRPEELGKIPLWFMAHYHHSYNWEDRGRTLFGCPALEATKSSEYMLDHYGVWSPSGLLGLRIGNHTTRKWSDLNIF